MRTRSCELILLLSLALAGCGAVRPGPNPEGDPIVDRHVAAPGDSVTLAVRQSLVLHDDALSISFARVTDDSRCPVDVACVWAGDAAVRLELTLRGDSTLTVTLHTNQEPRTTEVGGYTVRLLRLAPEPRDGVAIEEDSYLATLQVTTR